MNKDDGGLSLLMDSIFDACVYTIDGVRRDPELIASLLSKYVGTLEALLVLFMNHDYKEQIINRLKSQREEIDAASTSSVQQSKDDQEEGSFY